MGTEGAGREGVGVPGGCSSPAKVPKIEGWARRRPPSRRHQKQIERTGERRERTEARPQGRRFGPCINLWVHVSTFSQV